jgi:hypothetical protein
MVTVYYLLVKNVPSLLVLFPKFEGFAVISLVVGLPFAAVTGWLHIKASPALSTEQDVMTEANPYNFKLPPGYYREAWTPAYLELLKLVRRIAKRDNLLTAQEEARLDEIETKLGVLIEGGYVGTPRRRVWTSNQ